MHSAFKHFHELFQRAANPSAGKPLQNNTRLFQRDGEDCYAIRLHNTDVVTIWSDGRVALSSGGWRTMTTKDRICSYAPVNVTSDNGVWYVIHDLAYKRAIRTVAKRLGIEDQVNDGGYLSYDAFFGGEQWGTPEYKEATKRSRDFYREVSKLCRIPFFDGIMFGPGGKCLNGVQPAEWQKYLQDRATMQKRIQTYCTGFNRALAAGMEGPSSGDCWYCYMHTGDGRSLGEVAGDADHLLGHLDENYYVPSLAWNAIRAKGYTEVGVAVHLRMSRDGTTIGGEGFRVNDGSMGGNLVRRALRDYLYDRLLPEPPSEHAVNRPLRANRSTGLQTG